MQENLDLSGWIILNGKLNEIEVDNTMRMLLHGSEYLCHQRPKGETHGIKKKQRFSFYMTILEHKDRKY